MKASAKFVLNFLKLIFLITLITIWLLDINEELKGKLLLYFCLSSNIYLLYITGKCKPIAFLMFFLLSYPVYLIQYYHVPNITFTGYFDFDEIRYYNRVLVIHSVFLLSIVVFLKPFNAQIFINQLIKKKKDSFLFFVCISIVLFIVFFGISGGSILSEGGRFSQEALGGLALFEYALIPIILAYKYSGNNKVFRNILIVAVLIFIFRGFLHGSRIKSLQVTILMFILFFDKPWMKYRYLIIPGFIAFYSLLVFGRIRHDPVLILTPEGREKALDVFNLKRKKRNKPIPIQSTQTDIVYASARFVAFVDQDILNTQQRISSFGYTVAALVTPYRFLPKVANLAAYKQSEYGAGGGGLCSVFFYVWLSYPGVIFLGFYIAYILNKLQKRKVNSFLLLYLLMVLSMYPRWTGYNVISLFKISMYVVILYVIFLFLKMIVKNRLHFIINDSVQTKRLKGQSE